MELYDSTRWGKKRAAILARDKYTCQLSKRYGILKEAELVHHIFPVADFPEYAYENWNLISLTRKMHNTLHDRDTDELTDAGIDLLVRTARKNNIKVPDRYIEGAKKKRKKEFRKRF